MRIFLITTFTFCFLSVSVSAKTTSIGIDLSGSNPLLADQAFAASAGEYLKRRIMTLKNGDIVQIKTFGARSSAINMINKRYVIGRNLKAEKVAAFVEALVKSIPEQQNLAQGSTNIIAWLDFTGSFDCAEGSEIIALTDGLESSSIVSGEKLLSGKASLPKPDYSLKGCDVVFYGLGAGWEYGQAKNVRNAWESHITATGARFTAVLP